MEPGHRTGAISPASGGVEPAAAEIQSALQRNLTPGVLTVAARVLGDGDDAVKPKVVQALLPSGTVQIRAVHPDPTNRHVVVEAEPIDRSSDDADRSSGGGSPKASGRLLTSGAVVGVVGPAILPIASDEEEWEIGAGGHPSASGTITGGGDAMVASVADVMQRAAAKQAAADAAAAAVGPVVRRHPSSAPTPVTAALGGGRASQPQQHSRIRSEALESVKHRPLVTGSGVGMTVGSMIFDGWSWVPAAGSRAKEDADAALAEFDAVISSSPPERKRGAHSGAGASSSSSSSSLFAVAPSPAVIAGSSATRGGLLQASPLRHAPAANTPAPSGHQQHGRYGSATSNPSDSFWDDEEEERAGQQQSLQQRHHASAAAGSARLSAASDVSPGSSSRDTDSVGGRLPVVISDTPLVPSAGSSSAAGQTAATAAASAARHSRLDSLRPAPLMPAGSKVSCGGADAGASAAGEPDSRQFAAGEGAPAPAEEEDDEAASPPPSFGSDPRSAGLSTHATGLRMSGAGDAAGTRSTAASMVQLPTSGGSRRSGGTAPTTTTPGTVEVRTTTPGTATADGSPLVDEIGTTPQELLARQSAVVASPSAAAGGSRPADNLRGVNHSVGQHHYSRRTDGMGSELVRGLLSEPTGGTGFGSHGRSSDSPAGGGGPASIASAPDAALSRAIGSPLGSDARRTAAAAADATSRAERTVKAATVGAFTIPHDMLQSFLEVEARHRRLRSTWCAAADGSSAAHPLATALEQPWASADGPGTAVDETAAAASTANTSRAGVPPLALELAHPAAAAAVAASAVTPPVAAVTRASDTGRSNTSSSSSPRSVASSRLVDASVSRFFDGATVGPAVEATSEPLSSTDSDAGWSGPGGDPHSPLPHARSEVGQMVEASIAGEATQPEPVADRAVSLPGQPLAEPSHPSASQSAALLKVLQAPAPIAAIQRLHEQQQHQQLLEEDQRVDASAYLSRNAAWLQQFAAGPAAGAQRRLGTEAHEAAGARRGSSTSVSGGHTGGQAAAPAALGSFSVLGPAAGGYGRGSSASPRTPVLKLRPAYADRSPSGARGRSLASAAVAGAGPRASSLPPAAPPSAGDLARSPGAAGRYRSPPIKDTSPLTAPTASSRARAAAAAATAASRAEAVAAAAAAARAAAGAHTRPEFSLLLQHADGTGIGAAANSSGAVTGATTFHRTPGQRQPAAPAAVVARVHKRFAHLASEPQDAAPAEHARTKIVARAALPPPSAPQEPAASVPVPRPAAARQPAAASTASPAQRAGSRSPKRTAAAEASPAVSSSGGRGRLVTTATAAATPSPLVGKGNGVSSPASRLSVPARAASIEPATSRLGSRGVGQHGYARPTASGASSVTPGRATSTTSASRSGGTVARPSAAAAAATKSPAAAPSSYAARHAAARERSLSPAKRASQSPSASSRSAAAPAVPSQPAPAAPARTAAVGAASRTRVLRHDADLEALSADADRYAAAAHAPGVLRPGSRRITGGGGSVAAAGVNWLPVTSQVLVRAPAPASAQPPAPPALRQQQPAPVSRSPPALLLPGTRTAGTATAIERRRVIVPRDMDDEDGARVPGADGLHAPTLPQEVTREALEARIESLRVALAASGGVGAPDFRGVVAASHGQWAGAEPSRVLAHHEPHATGGYPAAGDVYPGSGHQHEPTDTGYHYFEAHPLHMHVPMAAPHPGAGVGPVVGPPVAAGMQYAYSLAPYGSATLGSAAVPAPAHAAPVMVLMPRSAAGHFVRVLPTA